jgi:hypothetical protein
MFAKLTTETCKGNNGWSGKIEAVANTCAYPEPSRSWMAAHMAEYEGDFAVGNLVG